MRTYIAMTAAIVALVSGSLAEGRLAQEQDGDRSEMGERRPVSAGAFAGVGFPRPFTIEGMVRLQDLVGLGLEYSVLPGMTISGVETSFWALAGDARVFPFKNAFFVGLAGGHQHLGGRASSTYTGPLYVTADTWFINPRLGVLITRGLPAGVTVGIDAGLQIPISAELADNIPVQHPAADDARDVARFFGKRALPTVDLLRLGFMF